MLGMTDRVFENSGSLDFKTSGNDDIYGMGRIRLRYIGTGGGLGSAANQLLTLSFTSSSSSWSTILWPSALPSTASVVKCSLYQAEKMTPPDADEISDIDLVMQLYNPGSGTSCSTLGSLVQTRSDTGRDTTSMVAFAAGSSAGKCVSVTVNPHHVVASKGVTTKLYCQYASVSDSAPPN